MSQPARMVRKSVRDMIAEGYGWEDVCAAWNVKEPEARKRIRRLVLDRGKSQDVKASA